MARVEADGRSELWQRVVSALVLVPLTLAVIWIGGPVFELAVAVTLFGGALEWRRMCFRQQSWASWLPLAILLVGIATVAFDGAVAAFLVVCLGSGLAAGVAYLARAEIRRRAAWMALGVFYLGIPAVCIVLLRRLEPEAVFIVLGLVVVVASTDIGAYVGGRAIGGPRLAPRISPGKTWAGAVTGVASGGIAGVAFAWAVGIGVLSLSIAAVMAVSLSVVAQVGDLFESYVKRRHGVKDSGTLIPGHGGILDRLDGLLFAAPGLALIVWLTDSVALTSG